MSELPLPIDAHANLSISKTTTTEVTDHKNFAPMTNKIETIGRILKKTFSVICDGQGHMTFLELGGKSLQQHEITNSLIEIKSLYDSGLIGNEEYQEIRANIIRKMKKIWE